MDYAGFVGLGWKGASIARKLIEAGNDTGVELGHRDANESVDQLSDRSRSALGNYLVAIQPSLSEPLP